MQTGWHYTDVLEKLILSGNLPAVSRDVAKTVRDNGFNHQAFDATAVLYSYEGIKAYKEPMLDLLLDYLQIILDDHALSDEEQKDFGLLKILFKIEEGDFYRLRYTQTKQIINEHLKWVFADGVVSPDEALESVNLQSMFSLSYDQYYDFEKHFVGSLPQQKEEIKPRHLKEVPIILQVRKQSIESNNQAPANITTTHSQPTVHQKLQANPPGTEQHNRYETVKQPSDFWEKALGVILIIILGLLAVYIKNP